VVYLRKPIQERPVDYRDYPPMNNPQPHQFWRQPKEKTPFQELNDKYNLHNNWAEEEMTVAVAARAFSLKRRVFRSNPQNAIPSRWHPLFENQTIKERILSFEIPTLQLLPKYAKFEDGVPCVALTRKIGVPVFLFSTDAAIAEIPKLKDMGFPRIIAAERLYQEIAYCLTSIIPANPDMMPEIARTDKEKVASHGFDVRSSFRPNLKDNK